MDIRLCKEEQFFSFASSDSFMDEECNRLESPESSHSTVVFNWNSENEKEINGDFSVIPVSGSLSNMYSISPPTKGNWQSWQHLLASDPDEIYNNEMLLSPLCSPVKLFKSPIESTAMTRNRLLSESSQGDFNDLAQSILEDIRPQIDFENKKVIHLDLLSNVSPTGRKMSFSETPENFNLDEFVFEKPKDWVESKPKAPNKTVPSIEEIRPENDFGNNKIINTDFNPNESLAKRKISFSETPENFDLVEYMFEKPKDQVESKTKVHNKAAVKKIDLKAQRYIVKEEPRSVCEEEGDVDIETVSDTENTPVLEAGDLASLLEQFEATEKEVSNDQTKGKMYIKQEPMDTSLNVTDNSSVKWETSVAANVKPEVTISHKNLQAANVKLEVNLGQDEAKKLNHDEQKPVKENKINANELTPTKILPKNYVHNPNAKKVLDYLPQEVVDRIKESGKRKPITVIEPIVCSKKTKATKIEVKEEEKTQDNLKSTSITQVIQLDHNYCSSPSQIFKKDSGFASSEEEERVLVCQQPTVKNADGKVMVSILKANTVHHTQLTHCKKKKLNLEEYKKRRKCNFKSDNSSPSESTCSSPRPEDDHEKMLRHQEKLRRMAEEVLHAAPKTEKTSKVKTVKTDGTPLVQVVASISIPAQDEIKLPPNLERKVLVSFGVNTDFKIAKGEDPLAPVKILQQIEPLLEQVSDKINENSLITSLIENIPKVISKKEKQINKVVQKSAEYEHGENKEVLHLEKDRVRCETRDVAVQTDISLINQCRRGRTRTRVSSSSSDSSSCSETSGTSSRNRNSSESSTTSTSSSSSSSSCSSHESRQQSSSRSLERYSRSRSRSLSPRISRKRLAADREHRSAVEERRIIYVGRIKQGTSKDELRRKFQKFGPIANVSLHFREQGENYGFVTFNYKDDAHEAYEQGNNDPAYAEYKISFGGRREFCQNPYADLDNMQDDEYYNSKNGGDSFDNLLREMQEKLKRRRI